MPFADAARSARLKLAAVMTSTDAAGAGALADRIRVASKQIAPRRIMRSIEESVTRRSVVRLRYEDRSGALTDRDVEAHGLFSAPSGWYLIGWCRMRDGGRVFRLDRIRDATVVDEPIPDRDVDAVLDVPFPVITPSLVE
jgi:predicted DNA-binding transcriptional regulator YafY